MKKLSFAREILRTFLSVFFLLLAGCAIPAIPGVVTVTPEPGEVGEVPSGPDEGTIPITGGELPQPSHTPPAPVSPSSEPESTSTPIPILATASPIPSLTTAPTATPLPYAPPSYALDVTINYPAKSLDVSQKITYQNTTGEALKNILLAVEPNLSDNIFDLETITLNEKAIKDYKLTGQRLEISLEKPLVYGQTLVLGLTYHLDVPIIVQGNPNLVRPQIFGYTQRQMNLVDWYPFIVPYRRGTGWVLHKPWFYGEHLVYDRANYKVTVRFTNSDPNNDPIVAASGRPEPDLGIMHYYMENGRTFAMSISDQFKVASQQIGNVTVNSYYFTDFYAASGLAVLDTTVKSVQTYTDLFGPYPHKTLAVVQGDFNDSMEYDGLYFLSNPFYNLYDNTEKNYLILVAAHETCHQWWFGRVANDQAQHPWLDEALSTYCEKLFYEQNYPDEVAWWWSYRVDYYQPQGYMDLPVQDYGGFNPYENATYRMGAHFMEDLRQKIGDEAFFAFLKDYSTRMNGQIALPADFFRILREHTKEDLSGLIATYFKTPR